MTFLQFTVTFTLKHVLRKSWRFSKIYVNFLGAPKAGRHSNEIRLRHDMKEKNKLTQTTVDNEVKCTTSFIDETLNLIRDEAMEKLNNQSINILNNITGNKRNPFDYLATQYKQSNFIKKLFGFVDPGKIVLGKVVKMCKKGNKRMLQEKNETMIYIPILKSIQHFLSRKKIWQLIQQRKVFLGSHGKYYDVSDGFLISDDKYFKEHPSALKINLIQDAVEICNNLAPQHGKNELCVFYYRLANMEVQHRSRLVAIRTAMIVKVKYLKKYGFEKVMQPLLVEFTLPGLCFHNKVEI